MPWCTTSPTSSSGSVISKTKDDRFLLIGDELHASTWYYIDAYRPGEAPKVISAGRPNVEHSVEYHGTHFYIRTNDNATNFKLVRAPDRDPKPENWDDRHSAPTRCSRRLRRLRTTSS